MSFQMKVSTELPVEQYKHLHQIARATNTTVGALVAELVRRQLQAPAPTKPHRSRREMTDDEVATLTRMAHEGRNNGEIGRALGRSATTINSRRIMMGLPRAASGRPKFRDD